MDIFKERFELYNSQKLTEERERRFYRDALQLCEKKCLNLGQVKFTDKEKNCFKNCSAKLFKEYLPLYETYQ